MCSEKKFILSLLLVAAVSCSPNLNIRSIRSGDLKMTMSVPEEEPVDEVADDVVIDSIRGTLADEPFIMNAIKDTETGEMIATDIISASRVTARFRNVAERAGMVSVSFDVTVPAEMADSRWQLKILPFLTTEEDTISLEPLFITGREYREGQLRGYERYRNFIASIVTDTSDFVRMSQLELFIKRNFPETYAMKTDSSFVSGPEVASYFGVTQKEALRHYTRKYRVKRNERRKSRSGQMFSRYVKDPILTEGIRLDTVLTSLDGDFTYRYMHTFRSHPGLKKVNVSLEGLLYERGERIETLPFTDNLTFYISSLATLVDETPRYRMLILERTAYDNTKAFIDFAQGKSVLDTSLADNASELRRIKRCIDDMSSKSGYVLDSLVIMASCSPEGAYQLNETLSYERSMTVCEYISEHVPEEWKSKLKISVMPENWTQFEKLVSNDTILAEKSRRKILSIAEDRKEVDRAEERLSGLSEYRYLREKVYPKLRSVSFDFHMHRKGMIKDTIHTTELDSLYMSGICALRNLDYKKAVSILRPYGDYNAALACMTADYNHSALDVLGKLDDSDPKVCYLKAIVLSRLGIEDEALKYFELSLEYAPHLEHRANLDPEMYEILQKRNFKNQ